MRLKNNYQRLAALHEAIDELQSHYRRGKSSLESNEAVRVQVISLLMLCGFAIKGLSTKFRKRFPSIKWDTVDKIAVWLSCCNAEIDNETIWLSLEREIPALKTEILQIFEAVNTKITNS